MSDIKGPRYTLYNSSTTHDAKGTMVSIDRPVGVAVAKEGTKSVY